MKQKLKAYFATRSVRRGGSMAALTALVLAFFYLVNLIVLGLSDKFSWYFYTDRPLEITVSDAADELFADLDTGGEKIKIIFCDTEENIEGHKQLDYVYDTANMLRDRYPDLLELRYVNLWLEPDKVATYRTAEDGTENTVTSSTVIIDCGGEYVLNSPQSFYTLDENQYVTAFNGEEVFIANILWVTAKEHPVAYFTANHGEEIPYALQRALAYAGYAVDRLDLSVVKEVPADAGMVIISAPLYNFGQAAVGSAERAELTVLRDYLAAGGQIFAMIDSSYATAMQLPNGNPPHLLNFFAEYGIRVEKGSLVDRQNALPGSDGYSLITTYADNELAARLSAPASAGGRRTVLSGACPLSLADTALATVTPVLYAPGSATHTDDGGQVLSAGAKPVLAVAETDAGGRLIVCGSAYLADSGITDAPGYGNKELLYALLSELGAERVPAGISAVQVDTSAIENLTMGEADLFFAVTAVIFPCALLLTAAIVLRRRKNI